MQEIWKPIEGLAEYEVSSRGNVRSTKYGKIRTIKSKKTNRGYYSVSLSVSGKAKFFLVHRLVAAAFCNKENGCDVVNHIDNNPENNAAVNLEWVTQKGNVRHASSVGAMLIRPVIRSDGKTDVYYPSVCATQDDGFTKSCVWNCCNGKSAMHKGYTWRYA